MRFRSGVNKRKSARKFRNGVRKTKGANLMVHRGGIRL